MSTEQKDNNDSNLTPQARAARLWRSGKRPRQLTRDEEHLVRKLNYPEEFSSSSDKPGYLGGQQEISATDVETTPQEVNVSIPGVQTTAVKPENQLSKVEIIYLHDFALYTRLSKSRHVFQNPAIPLQFLERYRNMQKVGITSHDPYTLRIIPTILDDLTNLGRNKLGEFSRLSMDFSISRNRIIPVVEGQIIAAAGMFGLLLENSSLTKEDMKTFKANYDPRYLAEIWVKNYDTAGWGVLFSTTTKNTSPSDTELIENEESVRTAYFEFLDLNKRFFG